MRHHVGGVRECLGIGAVRMDRHPDIVFLDLFVDVRQQLVGRNPDENVGAVAFHVFERAVCVGFRVHVDRAEDVAVHVGCRQLRLEGFHLFGSAVHRQVEIFYAHVFDSHLLHHLQGFVDVEIAERKAGDADFEIFRTVFRYELADAVHVPSSSAAAENNVMKLIFFMII